MSLLLDSPRTEKSARAVSTPRRRRALSRDRWFESGSLHRRVRCEPANRSDMVVADNGCRGFVLACCRLTPGGDRAAVPGAMFINLRRAGFGSRARPGATTAATGRPWEKAHGKRLVGKGPWEKARGKRPMGKGPWEKDCGNHGKRQQLRRAQLDTTILCAALGCVVGKFTCGSLGNVGPAWRCRRRSCRSPPANCALAKGRFRYRDAAPLGTRPHRGRAAERRCCGR
jgi:hypothetical protein